MNIEYNEHKNYFKTGLCVRYKLFVAEGESPFCDLWHVRIHGPSVKTHRTKKLSWEYNKQQSLTFFGTKHLCIYHGVKNHKE